MTLQRAERHRDLRDQSAVLGSSDRCTWRMRVCRPQPADNAEQPNEEHDNESPAPEQSAHVGKEALQARSHGGNPLNCSKSSNNRRCVVPPH